MGAGTSCTNRGPEFSEITKLSDCPDDAIVSNVKHLRQNKTLTLPNVALFELTHHLAKFDGQSVPDMTQVFVKQVDKLVAMCCDQSLGAKSPSSPPPVESGVAITVCVSQAYTWTVEVYPPDTVSTWNDDMATVQSSLSRLGLPSKSVETQVEMAALNSSSRMIHALYNHERKSVEQLEPVESSVYLPGPLNELVDLVTFPLFASSMSGQLQATVTVCRKFTVKTVDSQEHTAWTRALRDTMHDFLISAGRLVRKELDNKKQHVEQQNSEVVLKSMTLLTKKLFQSKDNGLDYIFELTIDHILQIINCERASIFIASPKNDELWCQTKKSKGKSKWKLLQNAVVDEKNKQFCVPFKEKFIEGKVIGQGRSHNIVDAQDNPLFNSKLFDKQYRTVTKTVLCIPMLHEKQRKVVGMIQLVNRAGRSRFSQFDEQVVTGISEELSCVLTIRALEAIYTTMLPSGKHGKEDLKSLLQMYNRKDSRTMSTKREALLTVLRRSSIMSEDGDPKNSSLRAIPGLEDTFKKLRNWNYDVLASSNRELVHNFMDILHLNEMITYFNINEAKLNSFANNVAEAYQDNPYHNFHHGFQVLHCVFMIFEESLVKHYLTYTDVLGLLVAALCHDVGHPGQNNMFQIQAVTEVAILYNDLSVLENHHAAKTFQILRDDECDILENLSVEQKIKVRKVIINAILSTDMSNHFSIVSSLKERSSVEADPTCDIKARRGSYIMTTAEESKTCPLNRDNPDDRTLLCNSIMHCSDLNNATLVFEQSRTWAKLVVDEFHCQYKQEQELGMESQPFMQYPSSNVKALAELQVNFIDFVVSPLWSALAAYFPSLESRVEQMESNKNKWTAILEDEKRARK